MPHKMSTNFFQTKVSCEQDVPMSPDVNTSCDPHHSCELGRDLKEGPRRRDVEGTQVSRSQRGPPRDAPGGESEPGRLQHAQTHERARTHTHTHPVIKMRVGRRACFKIPCNELKGSWPQRPQRWLAGKVSADTNAP